jgi:hypothetical protein
MVKLGMLSIICSGLQRSSVWSANITQILASAIRPDTLNESQAKRKKQQLRAVLKPDRW